MDMPPQSVKLKGFIDCWSWVKVIKWSCIESVAPSGGFNLGYDFIAKSFYGQTISSISMMFIAIDFDNNRCH